MKKHYEPIDIHAPAFKSTAWPSEIPELTAEEAVRAAKRLYRWALGSTFTGPVRVTSGNRHNWYEWVGTGHASVRGLIVNPSKGWRDFVHDFSHAFANLATPGVKPHSKWHAKFEARMVREVIRRGWLDGKLKDKPSAIEKAIRDGSATLTRPGESLIDNVERAAYDRSMKGLTDYLDKLGEGGPDDESQDEANFIGKVVTRNIELKDGQHIPVLTIEPVQRDVTQAEFDDAMRESKETIDAMDRMIAMVNEPDPTDPKYRRRIGKLQRIQDRLERWRRKEARAKRAIAKLVKSEKYYLKVLS